MTHDELMLHVAMFGFQYTLDKYYLLQIGNMNVQYFQNIPRVCVRYIQCEDLEHNNYQDHYDKILRHIRLAHKHKLDKFHVL